MGNYYYYSTYNSLIPEDEVAWRAGPAGGAIDDRCGQRKKKNNNMRRRVVNCVELIYHCVKFGIGFIQTNITAAGYTQGLLRRRLLFSSFFSVGPIT